MPWWFYLIMLGVLIIGSLVTSFFMGNALFNNEIKERMRHDRPVCCIYKVFTAEGHKELFFGIKYRTVKDLAQVGEFKHFSRKIYVFRSMAVLCGVDCEITYWVGDDPEKEENVYITADGRKLLENFTDYGAVFNAENKT